jgi:hypothetical protein
MRFCIREVQHTQEQIESKHDCRQLIVRVTCKIEHFVLSKKACSEIVNLSPSVVQGKFLFVQRKEFMIVMRTGFQEDSSHR